MSLKAKLEAVIYAAEEPVTLAQLAGLFTDEALEWKAEQDAAAAAQAAASMTPAGADATALPLLSEAFTYLELDAEAEAERYGGDAGENADHSPAGTGRNVRAGATEQATLQRRRMTATAKSEARVPTSESAAETAAEPTVPRRSRRPSGWRSSGSAKRARRSSRFWAS